VLTSFFDRMTFSTTVLSVNVATRISDVRSISQDETKVDWLSTLLTTRVEEDKKTLSFKKQIEHVLLVHPTNAKNFGPF